VEEKSYDYYFNICGDVGGQLPSACPKDGSSKGTRGSALQFDKDSATVSQSLVTQAVSGGGGSAIIAGA
jgi:hypothetical protein